MLMWLATLVVLLIPVCKGAVEGFKVAYVVVWSSPLEFKLGRREAVPIFINQSRTLDYN
jgi:hypothetical protein